MVLFVAVDMGARASGVRGRRRAETGAGNGTQGRYGRFTGRQWVTIVAPWRPPAPGVRRRIPTRVRFESGSKQLEIPIEQIQKIDPDVSGSGWWAIHYGSGGETQRAHFLGPVRKDFVVFSLELLLTSAASSQPVTE